MYLFVTDIAVFVASIIWMLLSSLMEEVAEARARRDTGVGRYLDRLNSVSRNERIEAATLLGEGNDRRAVPALIRAIKRHPSDPLFLQAAVEALGRLGDPRALPALTPLTTGRNYSLMQAERQAVAALEPKAVLLRAGTAPPAETSTLLRPLATSTGDSPTGLLRACEETRS